MGKEAWYYVLVDKPKLPFFLRAAKNGPLDAGKYGEILDSGWGKNPPDDIKEKFAKV